MPKLSQTLKALRAAMPAASREGAVLVELERLWADIDEKDGTDGPETRKRVELLTAKKRQIRGPGRRRAFQWSTYATVSEDVTTPEYRQTLKPLENEVGLCALAALRRKC